MLQERQLPFSNELIHSTLRDSYKCLRIPSIYDYIEETDQTRRVKSVFKLANIYGK